MTIFVLYLVVLGLGLWVTIKLVNLDKENEDVQGRLARLEAELLKQRSAQPARAESVPGTVGPAPSAPEPTAAPLPAAGLAVPPPIPAIQAVALQQAPIPGETERAGAPSAPPPIVQPVVPEPAEPASSPRVLPQVNWEQFMGVKLFAWIGGLALFLGVTFFVKYAFENNLIPPQVRVALGFLAGAGLLVGGVLLNRKDYLVTAQTLCGTGVVILYATTFACRSIYRFDFFEGAPAPILMVLITITAFLLAVRMQAQVVAILGILGGFLTPILLSTGVDKPFSLFTYIALLDLGLMALALHRRWDYLAALGAAGTVFMQIAWTAKFFAVAKVYIAMSVFLGFDLLFLAAFAVAVRRSQVSLWISAAAMAMPAVSLGFVLYLLTFSELSEKPWVVYAFIFGGDLCLLALALLASRLAPVQLAAGLMSFFLLSIWTVGGLTPSLLNWALGGYLAFAVLHAVLPLVQHKLRPDAAPAWWGHLFPPLALLLVMIPMFRFTELSWLLWPCVLLIDLVAVALAIMTLSLAVIVAVLLLTTAATAVWVGRAPAVAGEMPEMLLVIGGFAVFFFVAGMFSGRKILGPLGEAIRADAGRRPALSFLGMEAEPEVVRAQIPALSAVLPFLLLIMVVLKLSPSDPSPVFGLALLMTLLLLGLARLLKLDVLPAVGLACVLALEYVWHTRCLPRASAPVALGWYLAFYAVLTAFPFLFRAAFQERIVPWVTAALSGPAHFYLVHGLVKVTWPNSYMGLLPAAFAVPSLLALVLLVRQIPAQSPKRAALFAWFGGVALFFVTLIFPIQFDRQWITIGWALEGMAVLWLFHRVPHPGLRVAGCALLTTAFVRLALNPAVLGYQPRAATPILNWYLYAYGICSFCLLAGAWLLRPPRERLGVVNVSAALTALGAVLAFLLLNIEIADYFTREGEARLAFEFSGNFARDMTYSIAWALYALVLLVAGFSRQVRAARYAGLGLLSVTLLKLFIHDLSELEQLFRIGAFVGVAVIAIVASFLYQRYFARAKNKGNP